jgi:hypothetical protein
MELPFEVMERIIWGAWGLLSFIVLIIWLRWMGTWEREKKISLPRSRRKENAKQKTTDQSVGSARASSANTRGIGKIDRVDPTGMSGPFRHTGRSAPAPDSRRVCRLL